MNKKTVIKNLREFNTWRRGKAPYKEAKTLTLSPKEVGETIDEAIGLLELIPKLKLEIELSVLEGIAIEINGYIKDDDDHRSAGVCKTLENIDDAIYNLKKLLNDPKCQ